MLPSFRDRRHNPCSLSWRRCRHSYRGTVESRTKHRRTSVHTCGSILVCTQFNREIMRAASVIFLAAELPPQFGYLVQLPIRSIHESNGFKTLPCLVCSNWIHRTEAAQSLATCLEGQCLFCATIFLIWMLNQPGACLFEKIACNCNIDANQCLRVWVLLRYIYAVPALTFVFPSSIRTASLIQKIRDEG